MSVFGSIGDSYLYCLLSTNSGTNYCL